MSNSLFPIFWPTIILLSLAGWGAALRYALMVGKMQTFADDLLGSAFLGVFLICFLSLFFNFWRGLGMNPGLWLLAFGGGFFLFSAARLRSWRRDVGPIVLVSVTISLLLGRMRFGYDAGLYHIPYMNWIAEGPVPLGLANLENRLGLNSTWLLFVSATRIGAIHDWAHVIEAQIAISALVLTWLLRTFVIEFALGLTPRAILLATSTLALVAFLGIAKSVTSTDHPANLCAFLAWVVFSLYSLDTDRQVTHWQRYFSFASLLSVLAITFKLSMLPIAILPALMLHQAWRDRIWIGGRTAYVFSAILGTFVLFWLSRSFLMSGCALFPVSSTCVSVPWVVPRVDGNLTAEAVMAWARSPSPDYRKYSDFFDIRWIPDWLGRPNILLPVIVSTTTAAVVGAITCLMDRGNSLRANIAGKYRKWWVGSLSTAAAGIILSFVKAPDPRFCWAFILICNATLVCQAVIMYAPSLPKLHMPVGSIVKRFVAGGLLLITFLAILTMRTPDFDPPVPETKRIYSGNGWPAFHPVYGDQCWASFPCTPAPIGAVNANLVGGRWIFTKE